MLLMPQPLSSADMTSKAATRPPKPYLDVICMIR
jgi:hypothetical protein